MRWDLKEMYEDFLSDYSYDLKKEFAGLMDRDLSCWDIFEGEDFEKYCEKEFEEYYEDLKYKWL